jgi:hypothetical protein
MLEEFIGQRVVVDLRSTFICIGTLTRIDDHFLEMTDADLHDMRDSETTREHYIASAADTGIKRNRKRVMVVRDDIAAVSRLADVVDE